MHKQKIWALGVALWMACSARAAEINWSQTGIFNQAPLEIKLGVESKDPNPSLVAAVLWNDGVSNRLNAVHVPPPYDGGGVTNTPLETSGGLFALGDICTIGNVLLVPYIKDFNLKVARFNGMSWSTSTLADTVANDFDNAQCGETSAGAFILGHDLTDGESEYFRTTDAGLNYTFYGRYASAGPFDGGVREPLATNSSFAKACALFQQPTGPVRIKCFDSSQSPPTFTETPVMNLPAPSGFSFVKEGFGVRTGEYFYFTYNADGNARIARIDPDTPGSLEQQNLGPVNNNGSQFGFQGISAFPILDGHGLLYLLMNMYTELAEVFRFFGALPVFDLDYPLSGVGGPVDSCLRTRPNGHQNIVIAGPRVGSMGTDLFTRRVWADSVFTDGFEAGDVSAWECP